MVSHAKLLGFLHQPNLQLLRIALIAAVKQSRLKRNLSQTDLAERMQSSQSRVAKLEAGDTSVSLDLIVRALLATGATRRDVQKVFSSKIPVSA